MDALTTHDIMLCLVFMSSLNIWHLVEKEGRKKGRREGREKKEGTNRIMFRIVYRRNLLLFLPHDIE